MTKLIAAFRNFANASRNWCIYLPPCFQVLQVSCEIRRRTLGYINRGLRLDFCSGHGLHAQLHLSVLYSGKVTSLKGSSRGNSDCEQNTKKISTAEGRVLLTVFIWRRCQLLILHSVDDRWVSAMRMRGETEGILEYRSCHRRNHTSPLLFQY